MYRHGDLLVHQVNRPKRRLIKAWVDGDVSPMAAVEAKMDTEPALGTGDRVQVSACTNAGNGDTDVEIKAFGFYWSPSEIKFSLNPGTVRKLAQFFGAMADFEEIGK